MLFEESAFHNSLGIESYELSTKGTSVNFGDDAPDEEKTFLDACMAKEVKYRVAKNESND